MESIGPFFDNLNLYGASNQLSSRLIPYTSLTTSTSIRGVAEAIWAGAQILNSPLQSGAPGTFGIVPPFLLGNMPAATRDKANQTGANPGLYEAAWHVIYATCVVIMLLYSLELMGHTGHGQLVPVRRLAMQLRKQSMVPLIPSPLSALQAAIRTKAMLSRQIGSKVSYYCYFPPVL